MRRPTPAATLLAYHRAAVAGVRAPRHDDEPQVGWFSMREARGGPLIPVRIWVRQIVDPDTGDLAEPETLHATIGRAEEADPLNVWPRCRAISRTAWEELIALHAADPAMAATQVALATDSLLLGPRKDA